MENPLGFNEIAKSLELVKKIKKDVNGTKLTG
jgi:hypothetical protein